MSGKLEPAPDLLMVVSHYRPLVNVRKDFFQGYCPFCPSSEETFFLRERLGEWYCYNCRAGGDVYDYVAKINNISRDEAAEIIRTIPSAGSLGYREEVPVAEPSVAPAQASPLREGEVIEAAKLEIVLSAPKADDSYWQEVLRKLKSVGSYRSSWVMNAQGHALAVDGDDQALQTCSADFPLLAQSMFDSADTLFASADKAGKQVYCVSLASSEGAALVLRCGSSPEVSYIVLRLSSPAALAAARLQLLVVAEAH
ncbi:MAG: CHC2 zinc finger domain-containing protein [Sulfuritalea sp.]|nr:CHC2 zinc finger domain-containing protein [Sulfuritalea sp.]MDP1984391.1 CHC2 zinc finger domain-containing protein [Sulfuritalea sp.]